MELLSNESPGIIVRFSIIPGLFLSAPVHRELFFIVKQTAFLEFLAGDAVTNPG